MKNDILETGLSLKKAATLNGVCINKNKRPVSKMGFTLVELIVVITILAILGTIAIMAFSGYSKNARDSARISDIGNIKKSLELWILQSGTYPEPTLPIPVTFSGSYTLWNQGTFGDSVISTVGKLDKKPVDPLYDTEYTYSVTNSKKEYQIATVFEKDMASNAVIPQTYAATTNATAYVSGNYNGILTTINGNPSYIIALPSIILSDLTNNNLDGTSEYQLVYEGKSNIPHSYANKNLTMTGNNLGFVPKVVWSGTGVENLNNQIQFQILVTNLQTVYNSGSLFASLPEYTSIANETGLTPIVLGSIKTLLETTTKQTFSNISMTPLVGCSPGSYSVTGNTPCTQTSAGYYTSTSGATSQTQCLAGYYCDAGSTSSTQNQCPANSWCAAGSSAPTACIGGKTSPTGSTNINQCILPFSATGGTITTYSSGGINYKVHTFSSLGASTFSVTAGSSDIDYLVIAGGGGGGTGGGGAGGAGGYIEGVLTNVSVGNYSVVVGAKGNGGPSANTSGSNGGNSSFTGFISIGGGGGSYGLGCCTTPAGANGGSGGGGGGGSNNGNSGSGGLGTVGQGYNGIGGIMYGGSGGGAGGNGSWSGGGPGKTSTISGTSYCYAGGGGGNGTTGGATCGGGAKNTAATYYGGGGGSGYSGYQGIVIIRYRVQ